MRWLLVLSVLVLAGCGSSKSTSGSDAKLARSEASSVALYRNASWQVTSVEHVSRSVWLAHLSNRGGGAATKTAACILIDLDRFNTHFGDKVTFDGAVGTQCE